MHKIFDYEDLMTKTGRRRPAMYEHASKIYRLLGCASDFAVTPPLQLSTSFLTVFFPIEGGAEKSLQNLVEA